MNLPANRLNVSGHKQWACAHCTDYCFQLASYGWGFNATTSIETFAHNHGRVNFAFGYKADLVQHNKDQYVCYVTVASEARCLMIAQA